MAAYSVMIIPGDCECQGTFVPKRITMPAASVGKEAIAPGANVEATKLEQQYRVTYDQPSTTTARATVADARCVFYIARNDETLIDLNAGLAEANVGAAEVDIDLLKNGTTILTAPIALDSGDAAFALVAAAIASASLVAGDVLELTVDATAGGGTLGKGLFVVATVRGKP